MHISAHLSTSQHIFASCAALVDGGLLRDCCSVWGVQAAPLVFARVAQLDRQPPPLINQRVTTSVTRHMTKQQQHVTTSVTTSVTKQQQQQHVAQQQQHVTKQQQQQRVTTAKKPCERYDDLNHQRPTPGFDEHVVSGFSADDAAFLRQLNEHDLAVTAEAERLHHLDVLSLDRLRSAGVMGSSREPAWTHASTVWTDDMEPGPSIGGCCGFACHAQGDFEYVGRGGEAGGR
jgi:hypothetical protein